MSSVKSRKLPETFVPYEDSVVFTIEGNRVLSPSIGNCRLEEIIGNYADFYYTNPCSHEQQNAIVETVILVMNEFRPFGAFVVYDGIAYWEVAESVIRQEIKNLFTLQRSLRTRNPSSSKTREAADPMIVLDDLPGKGRPVLGTSSAMLENSHPALVVDEDRPTMMGVLPRDMRTALVVDEDRPVIMGVLPRDIRITTGGRRGVSPQLGETPQHRSLKVRPEAESTRTTGDEDLYYSRRPTLQDMVLNNYQQKFLFDQYHHHAPAFEQHPPLRGVDNEKGLNGEERFHNNGVRTNVLSGVSGRRSGEEFPDYSGEQKRSRAPSNTRAAKEHPMESDLGEGEASSCISDKRSKLVLEDWKDYAPSSSSLPRGLPKTMTLLPYEYKPTVDTVVIAKGNAKHLPGNQKLVALAKTYIHEYEKETTTRQERAKIIRDIICRMYDECPKAAFVRFDGDRYWEANEHAAREKISQLFRNILANTYRSSSSNKAALRRIRRKNARTKNDAAANITQQGDGSHLVDSSILDRRCETGGGETDRLNGGTNEPGEAADEHREMPSTIPPLESKDQHSHDQTSAGLVTGMPQLLATGHGPRQRIISDIDQSHEHVGPAGGGGSSGTSRADPPRRASSSDDCGGFGEQSPGSLASTSNSDAFDDPYQLDHRNPSLGSSSKLFADSH